MKIDFNNMLKPAIGPHGIALDVVERMSVRIADVHKGMCAKKDAMAWRALPYNQDEIAADMEKLAAEINSRFENFVVLGIGGSALGSKALFSALKHTHYNELTREKRGGVRFYVEDNVDPDRMNALFDVIDPAKTAFHVITKSGETVETMAQFMIVLHLIEAKIGDRFKENIIVTTDKEKGIMKKICNQYGFKTYIVPEGVGGRFSVLSPVGLLSAAVLNIDVKAMLAGAAAMDKACCNEDLYKNPAYMYALLHCIAMAEDVNISVMMPYADGLGSMAEWFAQLWAESLGKNVDNRGNTVHTGQTPVRALGVTDQHSQIQLYTEGPFDKIIEFIGVEEFGTTLTIPKPPIDVMDAAYLAGQTLNRLIASEALATEYAVTKAGKMNMKIILKKIEASEVGALFFFLEMATAAAGELLNINAFDQPGVEEGKIATFALMGRQGYDKKATELAEGAKKDSQFVMQVD
ncbi:MAG: glucose-6-phosphate isomerase [Eubacteriales bacterium]